MGDVVSLNDRRGATPSSTARDALTAIIIGIPALGALFSVTEFVDFLLISLWAMGFQIVPVSPPDDAA